LAEQSAIQGADDLVKRLLRIGADVRAEGGRALFQEALVEAKESMRRTPVETGALRASHEVERPVVDGEDVSVRIVVGGPAGSHTPGGTQKSDVGYALIVHEDLEADHKVGQAKFLESTLHESAPHMAGRLAARIDLNRAIAAGGGR
jgi:hypothetical protein